MGRTKKTSKSNPDLRAKPIIDALQRLAREFAKREDGRKKLREYTGLSKGGIDGLLYLGKGSAATWINVFLCVFDLSPEIAMESLDSIEVSVRKRGVIDPADAKWFSISSEMDEDTKHYWLSILEYATRLKKHHLGK